MKVLGLGGAGSNILDRLVTGGGNPDKLVMLNTNARALSNSFAGTKVQLGRKRTMGLGCGGDPDLGRESAVEATQEIRNAIRGCEMVFLCVGLGGGTGSGAAPVVARIAKEENCFVMVFVTMPFHFEGRRRVQQATMALEELKEVANALLVFENDRIGELIGPEEGAQQAFVEADKMVCLSIRSIMALVEKPGMISIEMDEVMSVLQGKDSRCLFGFGRATGRDRGPRAVESAMSNPMLQGAELFKGNSKVLVHVSGDDSVKLSEVEEVMTTLKQHIEPSVQVLFGVSTTEELGEGLCVAIIGSEQKAPVSPGLSSTTPSTAGFSTSLPDHVSSPSPSSLPKPTSLPTPSSVPEPNPPSLDEEFPPMPAAAQPKPSSAPVFPYPAPVESDTSPVPLEPPPTDSERHIGFGSPLDDLDGAPAQKPPFTDSEPIFPPPAPSTASYTFDSRQKGADDEQKSSPITPAPIEPPMAEEPPAMPKSSPVSPASPSQPEPVAAKSAGSIFTVVDEDDSAADQQEDEIPAPSHSAKPKPMNQHPGVKIEFEDSPGVGPGSAPTITLDQPQPSLASKSIDASATRPYGPSSGLKLGIHDQGMPAPPLNEDVPPPPSAPPTRPNTGLVPPPPSSGPPPVMDGPMDDDLPLPQPQTGTVEHNVAHQTSSHGGGEGDLGKKILDFETGSRPGRFDQTEPTVVDGQDLDIPTYLRKKKRG